MIDKLLPTQRLRAVDAEDKAARREAILDAAERLHDRDQALPGVAELAAEAGLAKGTMYLYFETKEGIYLGLHQRHSRRFFEALIERLEAPGPFGVEAMLAVVDAHIVGKPGYLPLGHVCLGAAPDRIDEATHEAFHAQLGEWLARAGRGLESRLPRLQAGDGMRFLHHGYALLLGLYQLLGQPSQCAVHARLHARGGPGCAPGGALPDFRTEAHAALRDLWRAAARHGLHAPEPATAETGALPSARRPGPGREPATRTRSRRS